MTIGRDPLQIAPPIQPIVQQTVGSSDVVLPALRADSLQTSGVNVAQEPSTAAATLLAIPDELRAHIPDTKVAEVVKEILNFAQGTASSHAISLAGHSVVVLTRGEDARELGRGAFAVVHACQVVVSIPLTEVAHTLEFAHKAPTEEQKSKESIAHERTIYQGLKNSGAKLDHVVHSYAVDKEGLLLERLGQTLTDRIKENPPSKEEAKTMVLDLMEGIGEIHEAGYCHGDITADNCILAREGGRLKVGDMGCAQAEGTVNHRPVNYSIASSNQMNGITHNTNFKREKSDDLFAMGVLLYMLVHGERPAFIDVNNVYNVDLFLAKRNELAQVICTRGPDEQNIEQYSEVKESLNKLHEEYEKGLGEFLASNPESELDKLAIEMMQNKEMTMQEAIARIKLIESDNFAFQQQPGPLAIKYGPDVPSHSDTVTVSGTDLIVEQFISESQRKLQAEQVQYPCSAETLSSKDVEERFKKAQTKYRNADFTGKWIPHYSAENGQVVVTRCTGPGTYETLKELTVDGKNKNLSQLTFTELSEVLGMQSYYDPYMRLGSVSFMNPFTAPQMGFSPRLSIAIDGPKAFDEFKSQWIAAGLGDSVRVCFDKLNSKVYLPYTDRELIALSNQYPFLKESIGNTGMFIALDLKRNNRIDHFRAAEELPSLLKKADAFYETLNPTLVEVDLPIDNPAKLIIQMLEDKKFPGVLIGEGHSDTNPKALLIENMIALKDSGVKTLFLEHLFVDTLQPDLDRYFSEGPEAKMPSMLEAYLDSLDGGFNIGQNNPSGFKALVIAAHENGIRVVGIDTSTSYTAGVTEYGAEDPDRMKAMNYAANRIIAQEAKEEKYVALVGSMHVSTAENIPGLSEITGCPNIVYIETMDNSKTIESGVKDLLPQGSDDQGRQIMGGNVNFLVKNPKSVSKG